MTCKPLLSALHDAVSKLEIQAFASGRPAVDERDVEKNVVKVRFGNGRPNGLRHLFEDSLLGEPLSQARQHALIVERPR